MCALGKLKSEFHFGHKRALESVMLSRGKETAAGFEANQALRESLFGNRAEARRDANSALARSAGRDVQYAAALALAFAGDTSKAQTLADELAKQLPDDTILSFNYLPTIRAQLALSANDPSKALDLPQSATPYELGDVWLGFLGPVYVRGEACLAAHQEAAAVAEFQKLIDNRGIVVNNPIGALAHLQLGRAYVLRGDKVKAKSAYQEFLQLWKDADSDIPLLREAKAEYAKLQ
jgi:eukaryotic-like serine/threonine-protein kinase